MDKQKRRNKKFEAYPHRGFSCSDEVWEQLKSAKLKSGKNWTNFLKDLLNKTK